MALSIKSALENVKEIYPSTLAQPYVYLCVNKTTNQYYIGYRFKNTEPAQVDFPKYRTSSKQVKNDFDNFSWMILAEFLDRNAAYDFEQQLIFEHWGDPLLLNKQCHHGKQRWNFSRKGTIESKETRLKKSIARQGKLNPMYGRDRSGENSTFLGKHHSAETKAKISLTKTGTKASAEVKQKLKEAAKHRPPQSQETIEKRRLHHVGAKRSDQTKLLISLAAKNRQKTTCEFCAKQFSPTNYLRWHGPKCKEQV